MKKEIQPIDYVTKDYEGFRQLMIDKIPSLTPEWTDTSSSDFGIVLIELLAYGLDILSYYQDKILNENILSTAKTRGFVIKLANFLGYTLASQIASQYTIRFKKKDSYIDSEVKIPIHTQISTDAKMGEPVVFETDEELVISSGEQYGEVLATQGITVSTDILGTGTETSEQSLYLTYPDVLLDTIQIIVKQYGIEQLWTKVDDFLSSDSNSKHYKCYTDDENKTYIECGDGNAGRTFSSNSSIIASYRVGGGEIGNTGLNTITTFASTTIEGIDSLTNPYEIVTKGVDPEDIEIAKINAPKYFKTNNRAITVSDFEDLSKAYNGVAKAKCIETFNENNDIQIYIAPNDYGEPTQQLKDDLLAYLSTKKLVNINLTINNATYVSQAVEASITIQSNYVNDTLKTQAELAIWKAFNSEYMEFGEGLNISSIIYVLAFLDGVTDVSITTPTNNVEITSTSLLKLSEVTVSVTGGI